MICTDCHAECLPLALSQHLRECKAYAARMANGGAMVHTPGRTPINPTGERKTKAPAPKPARVKKVKPPNKTGRTNRPRRFDGKCANCGDKDKAPGQSDCYDCINEKARIYRSKKAAK